MQEHEQQKQAAGRTRRLNGMVVLALIVVGLVIVNYKPDIERVHCSEDILRNKPEVIMLGTWWCPYCYQARRYLASNEIDYCEYDIERSDEGERLFNEVNGQAIPVLIVGKYMMSGFDESRFEQLLTRAREPS